MSPKGGSHSAGLAATLEAVARINSWAALHPIFWSVLWGVVLGLVWLVVSAAVGTALMRAIVGGVSFGIAWTLVTYPAIRLKKANRSHAN